MIPDREGDRLSVSISLTGNKDHENQHGDRIFEEPRFIIQMLVLGTVNANIKE